MPKGIPLTDEELDRRRHEIFDRSVDLFFEKGFRETSMREIAEAAGMGKSSLYDYFETKDEILVWAVEDEMPISPPQRARSQISHFLLRTSTAGHAAPAGIPGLQEGFST